LPPLQTVTLYDIAPPLQFSSVSQFLPVEIDAGQFHQARRDSQKR
jgi:hypothetical protein